MVNIIKKIWFKYNPEVIKIEKLNDGTCLTRCRYAKDVTSVGSIKCVRECPAYINHSYNHNIVTCNMRYLKLTLKYKYFEI